MEISSTRNTIISVIAFFSSLKMVYLMFQQKSKPTLKSIHRSHATSLRIINLSCLKHLSSTFQKRDNIGYLLVNRLIFSFFVFFCIFFLITFIVSAFSYCCKSTFILKSNAFPPESIWKVKLYFFVPTISILSPITELTLANLLYFKSKHQKCVIYQIFTIFFYK